MAFRFAENRSWQILNAIIAVSHGTELIFLFGPIPATVEVDFANTMLDFYINFINDMDPGGMTCAHARQLGVLF